MEVLTEKDVSPEEWEKIKAFEKEFEEKSSPQLKKMLREMGLY